MGSFSELLCVLWLTFWIPLISLLSHVLSLPVLLLLPLCSSVIVTFCLWSNHQVTFFCLQDVTLFAC